MGTNHGTNHDFDLLQIILLVLSFHLWVSRICAVYLFLSIYSHRVTYYKIVLEVSGFLDQMIRLVLA